MLLSPEIAFRSNPTITDTTTDTKALKLLKTKSLAERVGFEFTRKRSFNNIERTAGTVEQWKAIVSSANGSQTDHGSVIT
jgi:hypothetical protein